MDLVEECVLTEKKDGIINKTKEENIVDSIKRKVDAILKILNKTMEKRSWFGKYWG